MGVLKENPDVVFLGMIGITMRSADSLSVIVPAVIWNIRNAVSLYLLQVCLSVTEIAHCRFRGS